MDMHHVWLIVSGIVCRTKSAGKVEWNQAE